MLKIAFNKENPELVFLIDRIIRVKLNDIQGVVEYYSGVLRNTAPVPDADTDTDYKVRVAGFEMDWTEVPIDITGTTDLNIQASKTCTPSTSVQTITADSGYTGLGKVTVNKVTSAIDTNIKAENIKSGITILGVTGTYTGA